MDDSLSCSKCGRPRQSPGTCKACKNRAAERLGTILTIVVSTLSTAAVVAMKKLKRPVG